MSRDAGAPCRTCVIERVNDAHVAAALVFNAAALKLALRTDDGKLAGELSKPGGKSWKGTLAFTGLPTDQTVQVERRGSFVIVRAQGKDAPAKTLLFARVD